ncbi:hypothetical protein LCGC14_0907420 [marine sediment metagenome]|uniref:Uncharacterized protein n=1 Tax=marine sediment metagenome TaxID=412755 RepID=A0A0F9NZA1_9ZZZZ
MGVPTRRILEPIFGEASLFAARNSDACWVRTQPVQVYQKGSTQWAANLYGGIQTNDDWASVVIPVNELPVTDLKTAMWTSFLTNAESAGVNIVIWVHDPNDYSKRAEITQTPGKASKAAGFNRETLDSTATELFWYGENTGTHDTTVTAGTEYTWAQFQADDVFSTYHIYRITFDYGWLASSTLDDAWVTEIKINGEQIPLRPDSGGSGRIATRYFEVETGDLTGTISPKTPYRLLSLSAHVDAVPDTGETLTLTVDSNKNDHFDTLVFSDDLFIGSRTSVFVPFGEGYDFDADDDIDLFQTNGSDDDWGVTIRYQTVFP